MNALPSLLLSAFQSVLIIMNAAVSAVRCLLVLLLIAWGAAAPATAQTTAQSMEAEPSFAAVDSLRDAGAFRDAFGQLVGMADQYPDNANVHWRLALTRVDMGEVSDSDRKRQSFYKQALDDAKAALAADSMNARAHYAMAVAEGRVALTAGSREKIRRSRAVKHHADRAIELDPTMSSAYHVRARWNREVADLGFFSRAIVKTVYGGLPEASFEQAVRDFQKAIELEDTIIHHLELGRTYAKMDDEDKAKNHLQMVLDMPETDPDDPRHKADARELLEDL